MLRKLLVILVCCALISCNKKSISPQPEPQSQLPAAEEPIHKLAKQVAEQIHQTLGTTGAKQIEINLQNRDILPPKAFAYLETSLTAQLGFFKIANAGGEWHFEGSLSKQNQNLSLSFTISRQSEQVFTGMVRVPDDENLRNTLAQFEEPSAAHEPDHSMHMEMAVPTPLAQLTKAPLDVAENCSSKDCTLLLLYSNELVERNWQNGNERRISLPHTALPSRSPSGKILSINDTIWVESNHFNAPVAFNSELKSQNAAWPAQLPAAKPGLNTYTLADGEFFDFQEVGPGTMAVVTTKNRLEIADRKNLLTAPDAVGGTLCVSLPYIYVSSASLPGQKDSILKFRYENGVLQMVKSEPFDGEIYDIAITDLNRDGKPEMLVTLQNERGIFIEVHEPF